MDCPTCGLINPPTAQRCDCGYDFVQRRQMEPIAPTSGSYRLSRGAKIGIVLIIFFLNMFLSSLVSNLGQRSTTEPSIHGLGYLLGLVVGTLFVSGVIALAIIWLIEQGRKRRSRVAPR
jgi:hypothetical protein